MTATARRAIPRRLRDLTANLPHWSEVQSERQWERPSPPTAAGLADLVNWAADIALKLTRRTAPDDHEAIERVRGYALAWLAGQTCPDVSMHDLLTTVAAIMAAIDRDLLVEDAPSHDAGVPRAIGVLWIA